jgi:hypothetical protein
VRAVVPTLGACNMQPRHRSNRGPCRSLRQGGAEHEVVQGVQDVLGRAGPFEVAFCQSISASATQSMSARVYL